MSSAKKSKSSEISPDSDNKENNKNQDGGSNSLISNQDNSTADDDKNIFVKPTQPAPKAASSASNNEEQTLDANLDSVCEKTNDKPKDISEEAKGEEIMEQLENISEEIKIDEDTNEPESISEEIKIDEDTNEPESISEEIKIDEDTNEPESISEEIKIDEDTNEPESISEEIKADEEIMEVDEEFSKEVNNESDKIEFIQESILSENSFDWGVCNVCFFRFNDLEDYQEHCSGMTHKQRMTRKQKTDQMLKIKELLSIQNKQRINVQNVPKTPVPPKYPPKAKSFSNKDNDSRELYCDKCRITCTGSANFEMHLQGQRHLKNVAAQRATDSDFLDGAFGRKRKKAVRVAKMDSKLKEWKIPVIGLRYVLEIQTEDSAAEPRYYCELCDSKADPRTLITHLTGVKHRQKHIRLNYPDKLNDNSKITKKATGALLETLAYEIETIEGRKPIRVKVEANNEEDEYLPKRAGPTPYNRGLKRPNEPGFSGNFKRGRNDDRYQDDHILGPIRGGYMDGPGNGRGFSGEAWRDGNEPYDPFENEHFSSPNRSIIPSLFDSSLREDRRDYLIRDFGQTNSWRESFNRERNLSPPRQHFPFQQDEFNSLGNRDGDMRGGREIFERPSNPPLMQNPRFQGGGGGFGSRKDMHPRGDMHPRPMFSQSKGDSGGFFSSLSNLGNAEAMEVSKALQALLHLQRNMN